MAHSLTGPAVFKAWAAAPVPRPPQPIRASFSSSLPVTWALRAILGSTPNVAPASTAVEPCKN